MITKKQFKGFSVWGFKDYYSFDLPIAVQELNKQVTEFFQERKAKKLEFEDFTYIRGSKFWTWCALGSELWPYQEIKVNLENNKLSITYDVQGGIWLRIPPFQFEKEVIELEKVLSKT